MSQVLFLITTYLIAIIAAGHGVAPIVLLLFKGNIDYWGPGMLLGWIALLFLFFVTARFRNQPTKLTQYQLIGTVALYLSWCAFAVTAAGEGKFWSRFAYLVVLSAPFQITSLVIISKSAYLLLRGKVPMRKATINRR